MLTIQIIDYANADLILTSVCFIRVVKQSFMP